MQNDKTTKKQAISTRKIVLIAMLGAISAVLMLIETPLPFAPPFLKADLSELAIIIGGFVMGPVEGILIILIKILLKLIISGTHTAFVGEAMNFCVSAVYMLSSVMIYHKLHTKKGAALSLALGTCIVSIAAVFVNYYVMFPMYEKAYGMPMDAIIATGTAVNGHIVDLFTMMLWAVLPFNLLKYMVVSVVTFLVYKRLATLLRNTVLK